MVIFFIDFMDLVMIVNFLRCRFFLNIQLIVLFIALVIPPHAYAAPDASQGTPVVSFQSVKDQAILYFREKMWKVAREQFDLAYSLEEGKNDFIVVFYRGTLAEKNLELEVAFAMAQRAIELSEENSKNRQNAQQLFDRLNGQFSYVSIVAAKEETNKVGRVYLESKRRILNRNKREQFNKIRTRFRENDVTLPTKIYLPYGNYTANNVPFKISANADQAPEVSIFLHIIKKKVKKESRALLYTGIGVLSAAVIGLGTYFLLNPETTTETKPRLTLSFIPNSDESK